MQRTISFTLNGTPTQVKVDEDRVLLWVLRQDLGMWWGGFNIRISSPQW